MSLLLHSVQPTGLSATQRPRNAAALCLLSNTRPGLTLVRVAPPTPGVTLMPRALGIAQRQALVCRAGSPHQSTSHQPYPFHEADYHRVSFVPPPYGPMKLYEDIKGGTFNGVLVFKREADVLSTDDLNVLEVFVAGDTAFNTWSLLTHRSGDRPMVHELMWNLLEKANTHDEQAWTLLHVAIVELRDNVFIGRLFFGDAQTGEIKWDCDCRPSDGCYLSLRAHCPFYVNRRVWDQTCLPIRNSSVYKLVAGSNHRASSLSSSVGGSNTSPATSTSFYRSGTPGGTPAEPWGIPADTSVTPDTLTVEDVTQIRPDDPEAIKLLKRSLAVAVSEEDFKEAIRLRDHSWMVMYREIHAFRLQGRYDDAQRIEIELRRQIDAAQSM